MKNTLEILKKENGIIRSHFSYADGCTMWELHSGKSDEKIITEYAKKDFYKNLPGSWILVLPNDQKIFEDPSFATVTQQALLYIYQRDNPDYDDYFC